MDEPIRARRTAGALTVAVILASLWGVRAAAASEPAPGESGRPSRGRDTGIYLSFGGAGDFLRLRLNDDSSVSPAGITWEEWGGGLSLAIGYGFGPRFRGEMALSGTSHQSRPEGAEANSARARFTGYVPPWTQIRCQPHLIGGFHGGVVLFRGPEMPDISYVMLGGDLGAGVRVILGRHWSLQGDYIHSVLDLEWEYVEVPGKDDERIDVGLRGRSETVRFRLDYDF